MGTQRLVSSASITINDLSPKEILVETPFTPQPP